MEFFDQVRFFQVSEEELIDLRAKFRTGQYALDIEQKEFSMAEYNAMVQGMAPEVAAWKAQQRVAMEVQLQLESESLARLEAEQAANGGGGLNGGGAIDDEDDESAYDAPGLVKVTAGFTANVWDVKVAVGDVVTKDQTVLVLEAMKMESPIAAPVAGVVKAIKAVQGQLAGAGALLLVIEEEK